jgi:hypothetical protein
MVVTGGAIESPRLLVEHPIAICYDMGVKVDQQPRRLQRLARVVLDKTPSTAELTPLQRAILAKLPLQPVGFKP